MSSIFQTKVCQKILLIFIFKNYSEILILIFHSEIEESHCYFYVRSNRIEMQHHRQKSTPKIRPYIRDSFDLKTDNRSYHYIGKSNSPNTVYCFMSNLTDLLLINTGGGTKDKYDLVDDCRRVIISPYTNVYSRTDHGITIVDVQTNGYDGSELQSVIHFQGGQIHIYFREFELISPNTSITYIYNEVTLSISLHWKGNNKFTVLVRDFDLTTTEINLFDKYHRMIMPKISPNGEGVVTVNSFESNVLCPRESLKHLLSNQDDSCIANIIHQSDDFNVLTTVHFKDDSGQNSFIIGSRFSDIIYFHDNIKFAKGFGGRDVYYVNENKESIIFNYDENTELDYVMMAQVPRTFSIQNDAIVVGQINVRDFRKSFEYQHIVFVDHQMNMFFPLEITYEMIPFIEMTPQRNAFLLDSNYSYSYIVLYENQSHTDYEIYRDDDNLLILMRYSPEESFIITIEHFYLHIEKWFNVVWLVYYDNGTLDVRDDFIFSENDIIEYKTKLQEDYESLFDEFFFNSTNVSISRKNDDKIGILLNSEDILPKNIRVSQIGQNMLVLLDRKSNQTIQIDNWPTKQKRISIVEFLNNMHSKESVIIRNFDRFNLTDIREMQAIFDRAGENMDLLHRISPLTVVGVKCKFSITVLENHNIDAFECMGFNSLDDQIRFVNKYCEEDTLKMFDGTIRENQIHNYLVVQRNNIILQHSYDTDMAGYCEPYFEPNNYWNMSVDYTPANQIRRNHRRKNTYNETQQMQQIDTNQT